MYLPLLIRWTRSSLMSDDEYYYNDNIDTDMEYNLHEEQCPHNSLSFSYYNCIVI